MPINKGKNLKIKNKNKLIFLAAVVIATVVCLKLFMSNQIPQTPYPIPHYEKISWQPEKPSSVYALLSPDSADEEIKYTEGIETTGEDTEENPLSLYTFYNETLTKDGFQKINVVGDPATSTYWVASYKKNHYYVEVQYYVTPENKDTRTSMVFSGILPN
jgi:hypothetical protein